jgi:hypothetical protein
VPSNTSCAEVGPTAAVIMKDARTIANFICCPPLSEATHRSLLAPPTLRERRHRRIARRLVAVGVRRNVHCLCSTTSAERSFSSAKAHSCDGHHIVAATATIISKAVAHLCAGYTPPLRPASNPVDGIKRERTELLGSQGPPSHTTREWSNACPVQIRHREKRLALRRRR